MRPDIHKQAATRKYIQRQKQKGIIITSRNITNNKKQKKKDLPSNEWRFQSSDSEDDHDHQLKENTRKLIDGMRNVDITKYSNTTSITGEEGEESTLDLERLDQVLKCRSLSQRILIDEKFLQLSPFNSVARFVGEKITKKTIKITPEYSEKVLPEPQIAKEDLVPSPTDQKPDPQKKTTEELEEWLDDLLQ